MLDLNLDHNVYWSNYNLRKLKKLAHKKYKISNSLFDYSIFSNLRKECKQLLKQLQLNYILEKYIENNIYINIKSFWKYIQYFKTNKSNIPMSMFLDKTSAHNLEEIS
jgi:hypothetical protein